MNVISRTAALLQQGTASRTVGPIGVDFGLEAAHFVQLESREGGTPGVRANASVAYEGSRDEILGSPQKFRLLIKRVLAAGRFVGRKTVIAIPPGMYRTVSINYKSGKDEEQEAAAVLAAMRERLEGNLADYVIDYLPVKSRGKKEDRLALVAVSDRTTIVDFLELARKSRLDVQALEIGPVAIGRLVGALPLDSESRNVLVINSGQKASYLTLMSGADLLFDQLVQFGEDGLVTVAARTLDMSEDMARELVRRSGVHADAGPKGTESDGLVDTISEILRPQFLMLTEEIKRVCLYAAAETRGGAVSQVYLLGSIARWPGADEFLSNLTGTPVNTIPDPLALFSADGFTPATHGSAPEIVVATGAALRGMRANA